MSEDRMTVGCCVPLPGVTAALEARVTDLEKRIEALEHPVVIQVCHWCGRRFPSTVLSVQDGWFRCRGCSAAKDQMSADERGKI